MPVSQAFDYLNVPEAERLTFENKYFINKVSSKFEPILFSGIGKTLKQLEKNLFPVIGIVIAGGRSEVNSLKKLFVYSKNVDIRYCYISRLLIRY